MAKQVDKLANFGDLIERFLREHYPESAPNIPYARNRIGFMEFVLHESQLDKFTLQKAIGLPRVNYNNWMDDAKTIRRETLDNITQFHQLTPHQEIGLWSIACGDLSLPSPESIAQRLHFGAASSPITLPDALARGELRVTTIAQLCQRTGLSLDKLRELASDRALLREQVEPYSKSLNITLTTPQPQFHNVRTAQDLARAFIPDDAVLADQLGVLLLGYPTRYSPADFTAMIEQGAPPRNDVLTLAREQRFHTSTVAVKLLGVSQGAHTRWEMQPTTITDSEYADAMAVYLCDTRDNRDTPLDEAAQQAIRAKEPACYESLMRHLMGASYAPHQADVPLDKRPLSLLDAASSAHHDKVGSYAGKTAHELLALMIGGRDPDQLHHHLSTQLARMSPTLASSFTRDRLDALLSGTAVPSMIEQIALVNELKPETALKDAWAAACKQAESAARG